MPTKTRARRKPVVAAKPINHNPSNDVITIKGMGWKPDLPDYRDHISELPAQVQQLKVLPDEFDLSGGMPPVYDQGNLGSCTANAIAGVVQYQQIRQNVPEGQNVPSRLFIYYGEREIEDSIPYDAGAFIRDGMKVVKNLGAPPESDWPYVISTFTQRPPDNAYTNALKYQTLKYARAYRASHILRSHIVARKPLIFGFTVFESFWNSAGNFPYVCAMPSDNDSIDGGHAVVITGYKKSDQYGYIYKIRNSWNTSWGDRGYFYMPEAYLLDRGLSDDFWTITLEEG